MSEFHNPNKTRPSARGPAYIWEYEYYDDDEPVSFEGLKAHRYSIVIGFWVGLAVFVIFMFFVLTLLTKTGAPHQENPDQCEKRTRLTSCVVDISRSQDAGNKACSRPLLESEANFLAHFNIPNFVNSEHSSALGDDDLLLCEPPIILDSASRPESGRHIVS
ncbi:hypothetical protein SKAU_G00217070 [Synaphobranchus kaupii]|uniref:Melanocortin 2 receptor accessory protein 2 n=1 Tax=Synaphobranchus kaupii TaxID=118154 RepID=A0A9Q1FA85_SYNKA|nr:hypothetical protein SKAU_G00217070 [Synaphobranchus kaupii]